MISEDLKRTTVVTALRDMVRRGYFNICTIDQCAVIIGVTPRGSEAYNVLHALHCVEFAAIPETLRSAIPMLVAECLNLEVIPEFDKASHKTLWDKLRLQ